MRSKKISAIGVVLTLALVLGVTVAFASEPKAPDAQLETDLSSNITSGVFYKDGDGKLIPVDPDTVSNAFTFSANEDGTIAAYAPYGADFSDAVALWLDGASLGEPISFKDTVPVDPDSVDLSKMEARLAEQVAAGELTQEQADAMLANLKALLDQARRGEAHLYMSGYGDDLAYVSLSSDPLEGGSSTKDYAVSWPIPTGIIGGDPAPAPDPTPVVIPDLSSDLIPAQGTNGRSGYIRKADTHEGRYVSQYGPITDPEQAMQYMAWLEGQPESYTIPLYDSEGNVIGEFPCGGGSGPVGAPSSSATYPVCAADGCTLEGHHTHDGVIYCGGEGHHGDTCDGDGCIYVRQNAVANGEYPSSTHHTESHHSESHHSESHHSSHH